MLQSGMEQDSVEEVVKRYCRISGVRSEHMNVILEILKFSRTSRRLLLDMLVKFGNYQTKDDDKQRGRSQKMLKGEKKALPVKMFLQLRNVNEEQLKVLCEGVLNNNVSLKEGLEEVIAERERKEVVVKIAQIQMTSVEAITQRFGQELTKEVLENYRGAKLGRELNSRGKALKKFVKRVTEGETVEGQNETTVIEGVPDLDDLKFEDTVVITATSGDSATRDLPDILDRVLKQRPRATIVIVSEDANVIENSKIHLKNLKRTDVKNVYFINDKPYSEKGVMRNLLHGLVVGTVLQEPLKECAGSYSMYFPKLVEQLTRPADRVTNVLMSLKVPTILLKPSPQVNYVVSGIKDIWSSAAVSQVEALLKMKIPEEEKEEEEESKENKAKTGRKRLSEESEEESNKGGAVRKRPRQIKQEVTSDSEYLSGADSEEESRGSAMGGDNEEKEMARSGSRSRSKSSSRSGSKSRSRSRSRSGSRSRRSLSMSRGKKNRRCKREATTCPSRSKMPEDVLVNLDEEENANTIDSMTTYDRTQETEIKRYIQGRSEVEGDR